MQSDHDVARLDVAMDNPLLVGVLHGLAHRTNRASVRVVSDILSQYSVIGIPRPVP